MNQPIGESVVKGSALLTAVIVASENGTSLVMLHSTLSKLAPLSHSLLQENISAITIINSYFYISMAYWHTWVLHNTWLKIYHHDFSLHSGSNEQVSRIPHDSRLISKLAQLSQPFLCTSHLCAEVCKYKVCRWEAEIPLYVFLGNRVEAHIKCAVDACEHYRSVLKRYIYL